MPVGRSGFFFFPNFNFFKLECTGGKVKKKKVPTSSRPFLAHPAGGQETIFYLRISTVNKRKIVHIVKKAPNLV